ncbi:hypothetical protein STSV1pORF46 [Sulfolobus virus STSV1]|uniref:hypothetical protein n=1 Tax=Sulfolobus virus STSV1 TaxID=285013 RepID=UPI000042B11C|nr:hypothetical protein STSV1pORF46 [Sulfolobus virus STSV1]CAH04229.1 hypothetical protein [Sulfolobus virus STSV1]
MAKKENEQQQAAKASEKSIVARLDPLLVARSLEQAVMSARVPTDNLVEKDLQAANQLVAAVAKDIEELVKPVYLEGWQRFSISASTLEADFSRILTSILEVLESYLIEIRKYIQTRLREALEARDVEKLRQYGYMLTILQRAIVIAVYNILQSIVGKIKVNLPLTYGSQEYNHAVIGVAHLD